MAFICRHCGSDDVVQEAVYVPNTGLFEIGDYGWCNNCEKEGNDLIVEEVK
jgi:hypothetical protein